MYYSPKLEDHFPFINCTMNEMSYNILDVAQRCADKHAVSLDKLIQCANSSLGNQLLYGSGVITEQLIPKKNYVPWIVVDNLHTSQMQTDAESNLIDFICREYKVNS